MLSRMIRSGTLIIMALASLCVGAEAADVRVAPGTSATGTLRQTASRVPRFDIRALHLQLRRSTGPGDPVKETKQDVLATIRRASQLGFNVLILMIDSSVQLKNTPGFASRWAYSREDMKEIIHAAEAHGMEVIPEVKLLTHQESALKNIDRGLMLNERDYDPNNPKVYPIVYGILDEIIEIFHPRIINIGHDEVYGFRIQAIAKRADFPIVTPDEFYSDTMKIYRYLKKKNVRTMMWDDMLLDRDTMSRYFTKDELMGHYRSGGLADKLPRDIILCDGNYDSHGATDFPMYAYLQGKGFTVWGAAWKDARTLIAFSRYVGQHARKGEGMIATTWWPFVAQQQDVLNAIFDAASRGFYY